MAEAKKSNLKTPVGRTSYANLLKPKANQRGEMKFSVTLIFDAAAQKTTEFANLRKAAQDAAKAKWGDKVKDLRPKSPFLDGNDPKYGGRAELKDAVFIRLNASEKPLVVDRNREEILDHRDVYSGCYGVALVAPFAYEQQGNRGVSFFLNGFQKVKEGEPLAGSVRADDFDVHEGDGGSNTADADDEMAF